MLHRPMVEHPEALYEASAEALLSWLLGLSPETGSLLIVGHDSGLCELAQRLCPDFMEQKLSTAGCIGFSMPIHSWPDLRACSAGLLFYERPKMYLPPMEDPPELGRA